MNFKSSLTLISLIWATSAKPQGATFFTTASSSSSSSMDSFDSSTPTMTFSPSNTFTTPFPSGQFVYFPSLPGASSTASVFSVASGTTMYYLAGRTTSLMGVTVSVTPIFTQGPSTWQEYASFTFYQAGTTFTAQVNQLCTISTNAQSVAYFTNCVYNQFSLTGGDANTAVSVALAIETSSINSQISTMSVPVTAITTVSATSTPKRTGNTSNNVGNLAVHTSIPVFGLFSLAMGAFGLAAIVL